MGVLIASVMTAVKSHLLGDFIHCAGFYRRHLLTDNCPL